MGGEGTGIGAKATGAARAETALPEEARTVMRSGAAGMGILFTRSSPGATSSRSRTLASLPMGPVKGASSHSSSMTGSGRFSVVVRGDDLAHAARVVHTAYELDGDAEAVIHAGTGR